MRKEFNTTGLCLPKLHYMCDMSRKLALTRQMAEAGKYFLIHRPRQYGKTTLLRLLMHDLQARGYDTLSLSFEGLGTEVFLREERFAPVFIEQMALIAGLDSPELAAEIREAGQGISSLGGLSGLIGHICRSRRMVLLIDEVDKSSNHALFIDFLGMLRTRYLSRDILPTFHSVILAGLHDIKSLKLKMRPESESQYNSPWNIAAEYEVDLAFSPEEIAPMLADYSAAEGVEVDAARFSERIHYYTSGYPYLVSRLCQLIATEMLGEEKRWTEEMLEKALRRVLSEHSTLFDSLIGKMEEHDALRGLAWSILMEGKHVGFNRDNPTIHLGLLYGVFREDADRLLIHNRIHEQRLYNYLTSKAETEGGGSNYYPSSAFLRPDGGLDFRRVLEKFQAFMREQRSRKDAKFLERDGRLVFLAFVSPIINGQGFSFKEPQISEEKRLDLVLTYRREKFVAELKVWRGPAAHAEGLDQLADYLDRQGMDSGYLLIFGKEEEGISEITHAGKRIWVAGV